MTPSFAWSLAHLYGATCTADLDEGFAGRELAGSALARTGPAIPLDVDHTTLITWNYEGSVE